MLEGTDCGKDEVPIDQSGRMDIVNRGSGHEISIVVFLNVTVDDERYRPAIVECQLLEVGRQKVFNAPDPMNNGLFSLVQKENQLGKVL